MNLGADAYTKTPHQWKISEKRKKMTTN